MTVIEQPCATLIGDIINSRRLRTQRSAAQKELLDLLEGINVEFADSILSKFLVTIGDEFQGILSKPSIIPDLMWKLDSSLSYSKIRVGIGYGTLNTQLQEFAIGTDGPAWYNARTAIGQAKKSNRLGGVFLGFGDSEDTILNGIARLTHQQRRRMTKQQRTVLSLLSKGLKQIEVADKFSVSPQSINHMSQSSGWPAYKEGVEGWLVVLRKFDI